jgi:hypothetical protein
MHRRIVMIAVPLAVFMPWAKAYTWHDTIGWAQYGVSEVINYANWAAQEANTAATELNTLHSYEQEVIQLARMGDPAALAQLTECDQSARFSESVQFDLSDVQTAELARGDYLRRRPISAGGRQLPIRDCQL